MSEAKTILDAGDLAGAIDAATREVRSRPTDATARTLLFELLLFAGEWERALKQLDALARSDAQTEIGAQVYRNNVEALRARERLWADGVEPHFLFEPPPEVDKHLAAIDGWRAGRRAEANSLVGDADAGEGLTGRVDGREFKGWRDADDLIGPVLELIISDKYIWLPYAQVTLIEFAPPRRLRDLVWCPVRVETRAGASGEMFVPSLYEGSHRHEDDRIKLGRMTDWEGDEGGPARGLGLRLFFVGKEEKSIFEVRRVEFD
jgi:type VI secretion system protein ImpE